MQRIFFLAVAALMLSLPAQPADAAGQRGVQNGNRNGPVARMVELERRKNAWIRRTFFGR